VVQSVTLNDQLPLTVAGQFRGQTESRTGQRGDWKCGSGKCDTDKKCKGGKCRSLRACL